MAPRIPAAQIRNLQQIEAVVAGPDGVSRLYTVTGHIGRGFDSLLQAGGNR